MGLQGLNYSLIQVPIAAGLHTGGEPRAGDPPQFDILRDAEFELPGGLQTRKPYAAMSMSIFGGGTIANTRRIFANGDELLCFTKDALYSWNAQLSKWVARGTHLAVKVEEAAKFDAVGDQHDSDRAELNGTVVYSWTNGTLGYVAAVDKTTGSVLMSPHSISTASRLRVLALTTKILLTFVDNAGQFYCWALDPAAPATALAGASTTVYNTGAAGNSFYDLVKVPGADTALLAARLTPTTSYVIVKITAGLTVTSSVKARTCTLSIALSCEPTGASVQIARVNGTNVQGDYITISSLADVTVNQAIGTFTSSTTPQAQLTMAHRSVTTGGAYRCYVFWTETQAGITTGEDQQVKHNWVDTAGTLGTQATFINMISIGSRAFDYNGSVYVWLLFAGQSVFTTLATPLQNSLFLYRDDKFLAAKALSNHAARANGAGFFPSTLSRLPGVALVSGSTTFALCRDEQRSFGIDGTGHPGFAARASVDIVFTFDSDEARRCTRLGETLYVACGEGLLQYDGVGLYETSFHTAPWYCVPVFKATGAIPDGTYTYKATYRWSNAKGDRERSTSLSSYDGVMATGPDGFTVYVLGCYVTHKTLNPPAVEVWRTRIAPTSDSPFYLVSDPNPSVVANPNQYVQDDVTALFQGTPFTDEIADATAATHEAHPENGTVLENLPPPPSTITIATEDRIFIAGIAGDGDRVRYSKRRQAGEVAAFHEALTINVPTVGGRITALAILNETLVVFRQTAAYMFQGQGFDNLGGGQNFSPGVKIPGDVGAVSMESVVVTPDGVVFKSSKGYYILTPRWACEYIGLQVNAYDSEDVVSAHVVERQHQVRLLTESRMLVFDYRVKQWTEWTIEDGIDSTIWQSTHLYLDGDTDTVMQQQTTYSGVDYGMDVEFAWFKPGGLQGRCTVRDLQILGEYRSGHRVRVRVARDYLQDGSGNWLYFDDQTWTVTPTVVGGPEQLRHGPSQKRVESLKVRLTVLGPGASAVPTGEAVRFTGLALDVGVEPGLFRGLAAAQKQ